MQNKKTAPRTAAVNEDDSEVLSMTWRTFTGRTLGLNSMSAGDIELLDLAHGLSSLVRYAGQLPQPYTVAEHSVWVARSLPPAYRLAGLLHDASEAYLVDMPRPIKYQPELAGYRTVQGRVEAMIDLRFGVNRDEACREAIRAADHGLTVLEQFVFRGIERVDSDVDADLVVKHAVIVVGPGAIQTNHGYGWTWTPDARGTKPLGHRRARQLFLDAYSRIVRGLEP